MEYLLFHVFFFIIQESIFTVLTWSSHRNNLQNISPPAVSAADLMVTANPACDPYATESHIYEILICK